MLTRQDYPMSEEAELIARYGNYAVVALPGRRFPGCWVAADTLSSWLSMLEEGAAEPAGGGVDLVVEELVWLLSTYVQLRRSQGEPVPFQWRDRPQPEDNGRHA